MGPSFLVMSGFEEMTIDRVADRHRWAPEATPLTMPRRAGNDDPTGNALDVRTFEENS
jgi:hypothetical protein